MSRALPLFTAALLTAGVVALASAGAVDRAPDVIDGTGWVDYSQRPNFQVGSWVKYRTKGSSLLGHQDDYTVTILIAGEEVWWGEPCFWIETWTEKEGRSLPTATLMSYSAFGDTMASRHVMWFIRKNIDGMNAKGAPDVVLYSRDPSEFKLRKANWDEENAKTAPRFDTLGTASVTVPAGEFETTKIQRFRGLMETAERGDSTVYYWRSYYEYYYRTPRIPITRMAKLEVDDRQEGRTWRVGQSDKSPLNMLERSQDSTVLVEQGTGGLTPKLVPEGSRKAITSRKLVEQAYSMPMEPPVRTVPRGSN